MTSFIEVKNKGVIRKLTLGTKRSQPNARRNLFMYWSCSSSSLSPSVDSSTTESLEVAGVWTGGSRSADCLISDGPSPRPSFLGSSRTGSTSARTSYAGRSTTTRFQVSWVPRYLVTWWKKIWMLEKETWLGWFRNFFKLYELLNLFQYFRNIRLKKNRCWHFDKFFRNKKEW